MKQKYVLACGVIAVVLGGCASPRIEPQNNAIPVDRDVIDCGISSEDIRSVASKMAPAILALPEIQTADSAVMIKIADFKNESRFFIDRNLFAKRLRLELNRFGHGKVRFLSNNEKTSAARREILQDRQEKQLQKKLQEVAAALAASPVVNSGKTLKIAVVPALNTNLVNMNGDSFTAMLRSEVVNASNGKIQFLMPGETSGADYYLTGQFIAETMKTEGIINLADYIKVVDARVKAGQSLLIATDFLTKSNPQITTVSQNNVDVTSISNSGGEIKALETHLYELYRNQALQINPNVNKRLNVMLVDAKTKLAVFEKMMLIDQRISDNSGKADFILSGEISGLAQRANGISQDYLLISVQLNSPEENEILWEDGYEVKRVTIQSGVYR